MSGILDSKTHLDNSYSGQSQKFVSKKNKTKISLKFNKLYPKGKTDQNKQNSISRLNKKLNSSRRGSNKRSRSKQTKNLHNSSYRSLLKQNIEKSFDKLYRNPKNFMQSNSGAKLKQNIQMFSQRLNNLNGLTASVLIPSSTTAGTQSTRNMKGKIVSVAFPRAGRTPSLKRKYLFKS